VFGGDLGEKSQIGEADDVLLAPPLEQDVRQDQKWDQGEQPEPAGGEEGHAPTPGLARPATRRWRSAKRATSVTQS